MLLWHGCDIFNFRKEAQRISAMLELTIEPIQNPTEIHTIPLSLLRQIAASCLLINTEYGYD
jgi:hypothetical protein